MKMMTKKQGNDIEREYVIAHILRQGETGRKGNTQSSQTTRGKGRTG